MAGQSLCQGWRLGLYTREISFPGRVIALLCGPQGALVGLLLSRCCLHLFLFFQEIKDQETVDKVMEALDSDGDAECDFQEFVAFIAMVTSACHEFFEHE